MTINHTDTAYTLRDHSLPSAKTVFDRLAKSNEFQGFDEDLAQVFAVADLPDILNDACCYAMQGGGKRIRPRLVQATFLALHGAGAQAWDMVRRAGLCVELLHGYSLVHDDLPSMDNDDLRRGRATCHVAFGENVALLAGDALQALSFEVLSMPLPGLAYDDALGHALYRLFAPRARRMVAGQMRDVLGEQKQLTQAQLQAIHQDKTGALIEACVLMGAKCAQASDDVQAGLLLFAQKIGLGFQVQDDVLEVTAGSECLGKSACSDEKLDKATYVKLLGVDGARAYADTLFEQAGAYAQTLPSSELWQLTQTIFRRRH